MKNVSDASVAEARIWSIFPSSSLSTLEASSNILQSQDELIPLPTTPPPQSVSSVAPSRSCPLGAVLFLGSGINLAATVNPSAMASIRIQMA